MIYDATINRILADLPRCHLIYERECWAKGVSREARQTTDIDLERVVEAASRVPDNASVVVDIETLPVHDARDRGIDEDHLERNRDLLIRVIDQVRSILPGHRIGAYAFGSPGYGRNIDTLSDELEAAAVRLGYDRDDSGRFNHRGLIDRLDFICPTFFDRYGDFEPRAEKTVKFCRRWQRTILPFLMPRYHQAHDDPAKRGEPIPLDEWRAMVSWCVEHCDGALVWALAVQELGEWSEVLPEHASK